MSGSKCGCHPLSAGDLAGLNNVNHVNLGYISVIIIIIVVIIIITITTLLNSQVLPEVDGHVLQTE